MKDDSFIFWILLLVNGVSDANQNAVNLTLMVGDSVTLNSGLSEISKEDTMRWFFKKEGQNEERIAEITGEKIRLDDLNGIFKDKLELEKKNAFLTITSISSKNTGEYKLKKSENIIISFIVNVKDGVKNVPVIEGDSVTLHTGVILKRDVKWTFENRDLKPSDDQTGDLTITNIDNHQSGNYVLEINNSTMGLNRTYYIALIDGVKKETVKEGNPVNLRTGLIEIKGYDLVLWKTKDVTVAEINKNKNKFLTLDKGDTRYGGRLDFIQQSGNLIIRDSRTTDSGDYDLQMNSSTYSLQRTIRVTVNNSGVATGAATGIVVGLLVLHWCL
ncbi:cell adhesion molecule CEACAM1 isoform X1 [Danio rerio]|uniref:Carcinoembryonic antigen-related cell adhesion molecule 1 n=1 Tax=Danio rerio TaxID=7955 RepID=A0A140LG91_DANRE|nr:uncharacterized protein si:ch211-213a13.1 isoform X1 [Danio rerio]|eukprot:XP_003201059.1 uncharacterized protein si:ch211-213a13.1 isoform X1 [Danio rerio]